MVYDASGMLEDFARACVRCGVCSRTDCGNFNESTPCLGDICDSLLSGDDAWRHFPFTCAQCNRCTLDCPAGLAAVDAVKPARVLLLERHPHVRPLYRKFRTDLKYNLFSCLSARNAGNIEDVGYVSGELIGCVRADEAAFFPGCSLFAYAPELVDDVSAWLRAEGLASRVLTLCCGAPFFDSGFAAEFEGYRARVQSYLADSGIKRLVISCPHCGYELPALLEGSGVELVLISQMLVEHGRTSDFAGTVSFHDSCYDRADGRYRAWAEALFPCASFSEMRHSRDRGLCCGGGGLVSAYAPDHCTYRRNQRLAEIDEVDADVVLSTCFSCVNSLQRGQGGKPVRHYLELVFGRSIDWDKVYAGVDALLADPAYERLCACEDAALA